MAPKGKVVQTPPPLPKRSVSLVERARGAAYNVQKTYAGWQKGMRAAKRG